jgi:predicted AlkP superfamily phosphohydrolase/phosphomutase
MTGTQGTGRGARVLVIGLDSADALLVDRWCSAGHLPTLASLRSQGLWGRLGTTAEVMHVSAWPTLYSGVTPGRHGMYHAYQIRAGEQHVHRTVASDCAEPPFWKWLDAAGRRCIVLDAFMDYPLEGFGGIQIVDWGTWTWFTETTGQPSRLLKDLVRQFGKYPSPEHMDVLSVPDPVWFRDRLVAGTRVKAKATRWLLREHAWDMAFVTFGEPHGAGHYLWHWSDPCFPLRPDVTPPGLGDPLLAVYAAVDEAIGEIIQEADERTTVIVLAGDGMGPNHSGCHHMPGIMATMGLYVSPYFPVGGQSPAPAGKRGLLPRIREAIPMSIRQSISRCFPRSYRNALAMKWINGALDYERSQLFFVPNSNEAYVRLNLQGREPLGMVKRGAQADELLERVKTEVLGLRIPDRNVTPVQKVWLMDETFTGPRRDDLPDLVVAWDHEARLLGELDAPSGGHIRGACAHEISPYYTGNHRPNAFVVARGPHVVSGSVLDRGHILDLAPTVLALLGVDPPAQLEGRAWQQLCAR